MTVLITLNSPGLDTGPFDLYSNLDSFTTPFELNISKASLISGYTSSLVPNGTSTIRVKSHNLKCSTFIDLIITTTTTTTSTSSTTTTSTSTTTTTSTTSTTTTVAFTSHSVVFDTSLLTICSQTPTTVYTSFGATITTGVTVYTNSSLTTPLLGFDFISETGTIYNLDSGTGIIGSNSGNTC